MFLEGFMLLGCNLGTGVSDLRNEYSFELPLGIPERGVTKVGGAFALLWWIRGSSSSNEGVRARRLRVGDMGRANKWGSGPALWRVTMRFFDGLFFWDMVVR